MTLFVAALVTRRQWVHTQRKMNSKGRLRADRKDLLDSIGFVWVGPGARSKSNAAGAGDSSDEEIQSRDHSLPLAYANHDTYPSHATGML